MVYRCFTDVRPYTKGLDDLLLIKQGLPDVPVICQNYFINEYHVTEARAVGASSVFIHSSVLDETMVRQTRQHYRTLEDDLNCACGDRRPDGLCRLN